MKAVTLRVPSGTETHGSGRSGSERCRQASQDHTQNPEAILQGRGNQDPSTGNGSVSSGPTPKQLREKFLRRMADGESATKAAKALNTTVRKMRYQRLPSGGKFYPIIRKDPIERDGFPTSHGYPKTRWYTVTCSIGRYHTGRDSRWVLTPRLTPQIPTTLTSGR